MEIRFNLKDIKGAAVQFWKIAKQKKVIAIHGKMGAGKTTFIHALCDFIGVKDAVGSPTFSLINEYFYGDDESGNKIFHIDLYRLRDEAEAVNAGIEDCLYSDHICLVEWPEKITGLLPKDTLHINLEVAGDETGVLRIRDI